MRTTVRNIIPIALALAVLDAAALNARAAILTVTSTADSGAGSLRAALASAADGDTIDFSVTGTVLLTSGKLAISHNLPSSAPVLTGSQ